MSRQINPTEDRTARFMARVETQLGKLPDDTARLTFLQQQMAAWEDRYNNFVSTEGRSEPITDPARPPNATDFLLTITALSKRIASIKSMMRSTQKATGLYPVDWPRCPRCGDFAMDGHITCGRAACDEGHARASR